MRVTVRLILTCAALAAVLSPTGPAAAQRLTRAAAGATTPPKTAAKKTTSRPAPPPAWTKVVGTSDLAAALSGALAGSTRNGRWGAIVVSLTRGDTLFAENADALMLPASTMKMYTAAVVLDRFGPDYVFKTPVLRDGSVGPDGVLQGNLYLRGVGDPSLSPRFWKGDSPMDALARQVVEAGIKHVRGDVVGDATLFDGQLVPDGWKTTYLGQAYAARVSALSLNENLIWVAVRPNGKTAAVTLEPATTTIPVQSTVRVVAGSGGRISAARRSDGTVVVRGTIGAKSAVRKYSLVADNPPVFATGALRAALEKAGVTISGVTRYGPTPPGATVVGAVASPPLSQIVGEMNRESINVVAELLYRAAAATPQQQANTRTALATLRQFMAQKVGSPASQVDVADGSGLSELDRVTPRSMVELLAYSHAAPWSSAFHASLPVAGESGTLRRGARGTPAHGNLHAKTGTTNSVASLGGYVTSRNGEILAFAFLYNGTDRANARAAMHRMGATMADWLRSSF